MAELSFIENNTVEEFLDMSGGYVLDFSDRTFANFVGNVLGVDITQEQYLTKGTSKANRLRTLIRLESNHNIAKLLSAFYDYKRDFFLRKGKEINEYQFESFRKICNKYSGEQVVLDIDAVKANNDDKDFNHLAKLIKESIEKNEPESALDRLHTFLFKFLKELCKYHNVEFNQEETVNAVYGKYIKAIREKGWIESQMAEKIIQSTFAVMQSFNDIRNNKSFAHDNPILNYDESILIFNYVTTTIKFIQAIEAKNKNVVIEAKPDWQF